MKNLNLYWSIYKNLENEILDLVNNVHFTDDQRGVYSIRIADLIIRASTELESLAKDIYRREVSTEPLKSGDCFIWLKDHWQITKKEVAITTPYSYFVQSYKPTLVPFDYNPTDDEDNIDYSERRNFYSAYNSIKHDRVKNIKKANINILIRVMAALYLLNVYFKNQTLPVENIGFNGESIDELLGLESNLFSVRVFYTPRDKTPHELAKCVYYACNTPEFEAINDIFQKKDKTADPTGFGLGINFTTNEVESLILLFPQLKNKIDVNTDLDLLIATFSNRLHLKLNTKIC